MFKLSCTVRIAGYFGDTFKTAGRQKNVMHSNTENWRTSCESGRAFGGFTDFMKMNSKSVSTASSTTLKGSLNFCTSWPNRATRGIILTLAVEFHIDFWQTTVGFYSFPHKTTSFVMFSLRTVFVILLSSPIRFSVTCNCLFLTTLWTSNLPIILAFWICIGACKISRICLVSPGSKVTMIDFSVVLFIGFSMKKQLRSRSLLTAKSLESVLKGRSAFTKDAKSFSTDCANFSVSVSTWSWKVCSC